MGIVRSIQKGEQPASKFSKSAQKAAKKMKKSSVKKYAKTKHDDLPTKKESTSAYKKSLEKIAKDRQLKMLSKKDKETLLKIAKMMKEGRDYKDEYKKFQSSPKAKKYRAELNKYNRQKGTYGNGDGKDASHKGGKIVGFESQSKNRGRAEKSRLKKEFNDQFGSIIDETIDNLNENPAAIAAAQRMVVQSKAGSKVSVNTARQSSYKKKDPSAHKKAQSIWDRIKAKFSKKEGVNEQSKVIKSIDNLAKKNKYGTVTGTQMNGKTANTIMKIYNHPKMKSRQKDLDKFTSDELVNLTISRDIIRILGLNEAVYKFKGYTNTQMDEIDAMLSRAGYKGTPDFNKMTWTTKDKNPKIAQIIKSKGGKKIKESVKESEVQEHHQEITKFILTALSNAGIKIIKVQMMKKSWLQGRWWYGGFFTVRSSNKVDMPGQGKVKRGSAVLPFYVDKKGLVNLQVSPKDWIIGKYPDMSKLVKNLKDFKKADLEEAYAIQYKKVNEHIINFSKDEMAKLHKDGKITKKDPDGKAHTYLYKEYVNEEVKMSKGVEKFKKIVDTGGYAKIGGTVVDVMSATLFMTLYNKVNDDVKAKLNATSEKQLIRILHGMWKKYGSKVKLG